MSRVDRIQENKAFGHIQCAMSFFKRNRTRLPVDRISGDKLTYGLFIIFILSQERSCEACSQQYR